MARKQASVTVKVCHQQTQLWKLFIDLSSVHVHSRIRAIHLQATHKGTWGQNPATVAPYVDTADTHLANQAKQLARYGKTLWCVLSGWLRRLQYRNYMSTGNNCTCSDAYNPKLIKVEVEEHAPAARKPAMLENEMQDTIHFYAVPEAGTISPIDAPDTSVNQSHYWAVHQAVLAMHVWHVILLMPAA